MNASRTIVVGVDGETSDAAVDWAAAHAARTGRGLHLLHCPDAQPDAGAELLARASARARAQGGSPCTTEIVRLPAGPALTVAGDTAAMVVLGRRGGGARLGRTDSSVGGHVSRFARCPVAIVPDSAHRASGLLELDLRTGDHVTAAVRFARAYAAAHDLRICTVRPVPAQAAPGRRQTAPVCTLDRDWGEAEIVVIPAPGAGTSPWAARGHLTEVAVRHARCPVVFAR